MNISDNNNHKVNYPSPIVAWTTVVILSLTYMFSYMDRQILVLLVEPIKADLHITDTQVSLLTGFAFAVIYTISGIPMGRLSDMWIRKYVIIFGVTIWSVLTISCGFAKNFAQIFFARMGVGFGEAALTPTAYAMVPDLFPPHRMALGMSVFALGGTIGAGAALLFSGVIIGQISDLGMVSLPFIGALRPWQLVLIVVGGASLLMVIPLALIPEPKRQGSQKILPEQSSGQTGKLSSKNHLPFREVLGYLWEQRSFYLPFVLGFSFMNLFAYGYGAWLPSFFIRVHGWEAADTGINLGLLFIPAAIVGGLFGGWLADYFYQKGYRGAAMVIMVTIATMSIVIVPCFIYAPWMPLSLGVLVVFMFLITASSVLFPTVVQMATPHPIRAQVSAILLMVTNLVGIGFGPTAIALITDYGFQNDLAVGHSIAIVGVLAFALGAGILSTAIKPFIQRTTAVSEDRLTEIGRQQETGAIQNAGNSAFTIALNPSKK